MTGLVLIRGGGEMASGVAYVLHNAGYRVAITEVERPRAIRRTVSFAQAVYDGECCVEHISGKLLSNNELEPLWNGGAIPVVVDPDASILTRYDFAVVVDALMSKRNAGATSHDMAPLVIGLGPGLTAPHDCHVVVETLRGHHLGRFYDHGTAFPDTGVPGEVGGETSSRVIRAPIQGTVMPVAVIGQQVESGDPVATVSGTPAKSDLAGVVRGVMAAGCEAAKGEKIADIDPRSCPEYCHTVSDKARLIGAGVRSAIDWWSTGRPYRVDSRTERD